MCLIECSQTLAPQVKVSAGAKCNITNDFVTYKNYLGDENFIKANLERFSKDDLLTFLNKNQVFPKINPKIVKGTYFGNTSQDVI
ncbi:aminoacetone oxidase family FAD-binding enzyme, partial [Aliarcobacter butzleri]